MHKTFDEVVAFHGHKCPGLAMGYRMTQAALDFLAQSPAADEEIVAIVENDACGVDALQYLSGCTFGKGNLIFKDYGKQVYTLYSRDSKRGVRVAFQMQDSLRDQIRDREHFVDWLLTAPDEDILSIREVYIDEPEKARVMESVLCQSCGEPVMATRLRKLADKTVCIPCFEADAS